MRLYLAIIAGKLCGFLSRALGAGGGTSLPGLLALRIEPRLIRRILNSTPLPRVLVSGSNGKTTTARMLAAMLEGCGMRVLWNRSGANLASGIASALVNACDFRGLPKADAAVLEVDEASLPRLADETKPQIVLITNCFRDQLDRYGEVDATVKMLWRAANTLPPHSLLLLNADDPLAAGLRDGSGCSVQFFGVESAGGTEDGASAVQEADQRCVDARHCPACGSGYEYSFRTYGHLGQYRCPNCGRHRPDPEFRGVDLSDPRGAPGYAFTIEYGTAREPGWLPISLCVPGLYNVYNCLGAAACALNLGVPPATVQRCVEGLSSAFGRMESISIGDKRILLALVKNPVGFTEVIRTLTRGEQMQTLLLCLNDRPADGQDVSWIWDVDLELLVRNAGSVGKIIASGTRPWDMAVRLKYAGVDEARIMVRPNLSEALELGLAETRSGGTLFALPTYTALLKLRELIRRRAHAKAFWAN